MITINFFEDGAYYVGSVRSDIARVLAYAVFSLEADCMKAGSVELFNCTEQPNWQGAGFIFIRIEYNNFVQREYFENYKRNLGLWMRASFSDHVVVNEFDCLIDFEAAKFDAMNGTGGLH